MNLKVVLAVRGRLVEFRITESNQVLKKNGIKYLLTVGFMSTRQGMCAAVETSEAIVCRLPPRHNRQPCRPLHYHLRRPETNLSLDEAAVG